MWTHLFFRRQGTCLSRWTQNHQRRRAIPRIEQLESRLTPSWTAIGPSPQLNGYYNFDRVFNESTTGRISALAFGQDNSGNPALFLGAGGGGIWRSTDFGTSNPTWVSLTDFAALQ